MSIRIVGFTGSLREKSYNKAILYEIQRMMPANVEMEIVSLADLPLYNQDLEHHEPESVSSFKEKIRQADALLIASPEFNYSVSAALKNAIEWASRPARQSVLTNKLTAILGVGGRFGTLRSQMHLRQILHEMDVPILSKPEVYISSGWQKFDQAGNLTDEATREQVQALVDKLVEQARQRKAVEVGLEPVA